MSVCFSTPQCTHVVFLFSMCWLKGGTGFALTNDPDAACAVTSNQNYFVQTNCNAPNNDISISSTESQDLCGKSCLSNNFCTHAVYDPSSAACWLKNGTFTNTSQPNSACLIRNINYSPTCT